MSGQALDTIKGNYEVAIKRLHKRYDNKCLVTQSHIRNSLDNPRVQFASPRES